MIREQHPAGSNGLISKVFMCWHWRFSIVWVGASSKHAYILSGWATCQTRPAEQKAIEKCQKSSWYTREKKKGYIVYTFNLKSLPNRTSTAFCMRDQGARLCHARISSENDVAATQDLNKYIETTKAKSTHTFLVNILKSLSLKQFCLSKSASIYV